MNRKLKQVLVTGLMVLGIGLVGRRAEALQPDTMTLSVTPGNITFSVQITSVNPSGYQFGTVNLGATTISTAAIVLNNSGGGNVSEYFGMKVGNSAPDGWTPQAGAPGTDQFRLIGELNATQPASASFVVGDAVTGAFPGAAATLYGQASTKTTLAGSKNLWVRLEGR